jgi:hypothetical protein
MRKYKNDTLEYSKVRCYSGIFCALAEFLEQTTIHQGALKCYLYNSATECQQAFLAPSQGKQLARDIIERSILLTDISSLTLVKLTTANPVYF